MIETALTVGARRSLLICDVRQLPAGGRVVATRWIRNLAHRIGYECVVNGLSGHWASYVMIEIDDEVGQAAEAVVAWHGADSADNGRRWPLHPVHLGRTGSGPSTPSAP